MNYELQLTFLRCKEENIYRQKPEVRDRIDVCYELEGAMSLQDGREFIKGKINSGELTIPNRTTFITYNIMEDKLDEKGNRWGAGDILLANGDPIPAIHVFYITYMTDRGEIGELRVETPEKCSYPNEQLYRKQLLDKLRTLPLPENQICLMIDYTYGHKEKVLEGGNWKEDVNVYSSYVGDYYEHRSRGGREWYGRQDTSYQPTYYK